MHIEFFTEELSAEAALRSLLPRILGDEVSFDIHVFQGKTNLLTNLPARLRALARWIPHDWRVVIVVDRDDDDCKVLKERLNRIAADAGLIPRSAASEGQSFQVLSRIAIVGGTWECLERELRQAGYHKGGLQKIALARDVARHMQPERNRSRSFQTFYHGLKELATLP